MLYRIADDYFFKTKKVVLDELPIISVQIPAKGGQV